MLVLSKMNYCDTVLDPASCPEQYGFRAKTSTEDAVLDLTSNIYKHLDNKRKCIAVFLDLQKAFDTVSIPILLCRLENLGIRGVALNWFKDYLQNRSQTVRLGGHFSESASCNYGVPQGSTLGPTLFLAYINGLCKIHLKKGELFMFADDTALVFYGSSWNEVKITAEKGLSKVTAWLENSLLSLNVNKTKYICFSINKASSPKKSFSLAIHTYPCNLLSDIPSDCNCAKLDRVKSFKYLGVMIDEHLKWDAHISLISGRIRKLMYVFKNLRTVTNLPLLIRVYKSLGESLICYCICAWGGAAQVHLIKLERAQRAVLKVLMSLPIRHPTASLYEKTKVLSVRKLFIYQVIRRLHNNTVLGVKRTWPSYLDKRLSEELVTAASEFKEFKTYAAASMGANDFYLGQGRLDGPLCDYSEADKMEYLNKLTSLGVRNIEMEVMAFAAITSEAGVRAGIACVTFVDRLKGDQVTIPKAVLNEWQKHPMFIVGAFIKKYVENRNKH
ncbi:hypothetical protein evm_003555 [Chilo suppressalis]|nr:hypothetical protein evm_003555 [Chilo suppressalis]